MEGYFLDINICKEILDPFLKENDLIFYSVELVKEYGSLILRVILDKKDGLDIELLAKANEYLSERIDKYDADMPEYMLEVSSRGAERTLDSEEEINEALDSYIHVEGNNMVDEGVLVENNVDSIVMTINIKGRFKKIPIKKEEMKLIRLAVKI